MTDERPAGHGPATLDPRQRWPDEPASPLWSDAASAARLRFATVPADWTVWAFSDAHAVASGFRSALREAGLIDGQDRWCAPPRTALVGCGDYISRGRDSRGLVDLLRSLTVQAAARGGAVHLARGNHEHLLQHLHDGGHDMLDHFLFYGGDTAVESFGCPRPDPDQARAMIACLAAHDPELFPWVTGLLHAVRWRDVLFVHGGLVPYAALDDLGRTTDRHLWIRSAFFATPWSSGAFDAYAADGIERVVFGHTATTDGHRIQQDGRSLCLDTNACDAPTMSAGASARITLVRLSGDVPFDEAHYVIVPTHDAPDRAPRPA
jgi:hypothetical protein